MIDEKKVEKNFSSEKPARLGFTNCRKIFLDTGHFGLYFGVD